MLPDPPPEEPDRVGPEPPDDPDPRLTDPDREDDEEDDDPRLTDPEREEEDEDPRLTVPERDEDDDVLLSDEMRDPLGDVPVKLRVMLRINDPDRRESVLLPEMAGEEG